jgi:hypothetical protein
VTEFHLGKKQLRAADVCFEAALGATSRARVTLGEGCDPPARGDPARLVLAGRELALCCDDWSLPPGRLPGGWIDLAAAAALAPPFDAEVFSGPEGASFREALETRGEVTGPPDLATKLPAVVADGPATRLLEDLCSRHEGWAWWVGPSGGVEIGEPGHEVVQSDGQVIDERPGGFLARLSGAPALPGQIAELPGGWRGTVLLLRFAWHAGRLPLAEVLVGRPSPGRRHAPTGEVRCPASVEQLAPLVVRVTDEERERPPFSARARLMVRHSDEGQFHEDVPLKVGDEGEAAVPTGGVSVRPLRFYLWRPGTPAAEYRLTARSKDEVVAGAWTVKAGRMGETADTKETETGRYDIKKKR